MNAKEIKGKVQESPQEEPQAKCDACGDWFPISEFEGENEEQICSMCLQTPT